MTTLTAESSPELSGSSKNWIQITALYGIGPLLSIVAFVFLAKDVRANQREQIEAVQATEALVHLHIASTDGKLDVIARQLAANCRVQALIAKNPALEAVCEVGR